jgi:hypothetical protein
MILRCDSTSLTSTYLYSQDPMAIASMMPTCSTPFRNVFWIGTIHTLPQTPQLKILMIFLSTMENSSCKKPRESRKPAIRTIASHNSNQPETRINATKETRTNAMETITAMKSPFAHTISSTDIQMPNVMTLAIQRSKCQQSPSQQS